MSTLYTINHGVCQPVQFKGLRAQWIRILAVGLVMLLLLFALLYMTGINAFICVGLTFCLGALLFVVVYRFNDKYGEYGLMKHNARKALPRQIIIKSRNIFYETQFSKHISDTRCARG